MGPRLAWSFVAAAGLVADTEAVVAHIEWAPQAAALVVALDSGLDVALVAGTAVGLAVVVQMAYIRANSREDRLPRLFSFCCRRRIPYLDLTHSCSIAKDIARSQLIVDRGQMFFNYC